EGIYRLQQRELTAVVVDHPRRGRQSQQLLDLVLLPVRRGDEDLRQRVARREAVQIDAAARDRERVQVVLQAGQPLELFLGRLVASSGTLLCLLARRLERADHVGRDVERVEEEAAERRERAGDAIMPVPARGRGSE